VTVSAKVRKSLPASRMGKPKSGGYPMPDKKHAGLAKAFAAMHHDPDKAEIDAKANRILGKKRGGMVEGHAKKPHLGRPRRADGGPTPMVDEFMKERQDKRAKLDWDTSIDQAEGANDPDIYSTRGPQAFKAQKRGGRT
jgi:hypothetical protein